MRRRRNRLIRNFSYKTIFIFVFVVILVAAIVSTSNTSGALIIKRVGINPTSTYFKNVCVDEDAQNTDYRNLVSKTYIKQLVGGEVHIIDSRTDTCASPTTVHEYFCIANRIYGRTLYCSQGCENGACNPCLNCDEITATCKDSDGGKMFYVTGVVEEIPDINTVTPSTIEHKDACYGNMVREGYCLNGQYAWEWRTCPKECYNGACLKG